MVDDRQSPDETDRGHVFVYYPLLTHAYMTKLIWGTPKGKNILPPEKAYSI